MSKPSLTWDAVLALLRKGSPTGLTNRQIAELLGANVMRVTNLTLTMYEAGVIQREDMGRRPGWAVKYLIK